MYVSIDRIFVCTSSEEPRAIATTKRRSPKHGVSLVFFQRQVPCIPEFPCTIDGTRGFSIFTRRPRRPFLPSLALVTRQARSSLDFVRLAGRTNLPKRTKSTLGPLLARWPSNTGLAKHASRSPMRFVFRPAETNNSPVNFAHAAIAPHTVLAKQCIGHNPSPTLHEHGR
jgi:hypothetical protein